MQLPDEAIEFHFSGLLNGPVETWTPLAELQSRHFLHPEKLDAIKHELMTTRLKIASERDSSNASKPGINESSFIDYPQYLIDRQRRKPDSSDLTRIGEIAGRLRLEADRIVVIGPESATLGARAIINALTSAYHNEMPLKNRLGVPRITFVGDHLDNDSWQDLLDLLENTCVDPDLLEERWGIVVIGKEGMALEAAIGSRVLRKELTRYYGPSSDLFRRWLVPVVRGEGPHHALVRAEGLADTEIFSMPGNLGHRFGLFTAQSLLPAALAGLDVPALLLGAASMTRRFIEESFDRNPVLQYAAINHLMCRDLQKMNRTFAVWSPKLESLARWYAGVVSESLGRNSCGPMVQSMVLPRDLSVAGQSLFEGDRSQVVHQLKVRTPHHVPLAVGMADRNEDDLNSLSRRTFPELTAGIQAAFSKSLSDRARPSLELIMPHMSEHTLGQIMQMLLLATVVEARLAGVNPYGQQSTDGLLDSLPTLLRGT